MTTLSMNPCVVGDLVVATGDGTSIDDGFLPLVNPPYWTVSDIGRLWVRGEVRGSDVLMPGADGVKPYRRRPTVTVHQLPIVVTGDLDWEVDEPCLSEADRWVALQHNLSTLDDNLVAPPGTRAGTREARLTMPDGEERFADIHVLRLTPTRVQADTFVGFLNISIPAGRFAEVVS